MLTDFGRISSDTGLGTFGANTAQNYANEMQMASMGSRQMAKARATQYQNEKMIEEMQMKGKMAAEQQGTGGGANVGGMVNSGVKLFQGLAGMGGGAAGGVGGAAGGFGAATGGGAGIGGFGDFTSLFNF